MNWNLKWLAAPALALALAGSASGQTNCVWGSFDASRINYGGGELNGSAHTTLRSIINANMGTVAAGTSTLTATYLSGVDVFYTSLLNTGTGALSVAEQGALQGWIAGGGTLIVTADIFPLPAYESFTSFYGITGYVGASGPGTGNTVASHALTAGVSSYSYTTNSKYTFGGDGLLLGNDGAGNTFMTVFEPATGFAAGGRILVTGDHNMFTQSFIGNLDNTRLANNMAEWACHPVPEPASMAVLGLGVAALVRRRRKAA